MEAGQTELPVTELQRPLMSLFCVAYYPPRDDSTLTSTIEAIQEISLRYPDRLLCVFGDWNTTNVRWAADAAMRATLPVYVWGFRGAHVNQDSKYPAQVNPRFSQHLGHLRSS